MNQQMGESEIDTLLWNEMASQEQPLEYTHHALVRILDILQAAHPSGEEAIVGSNLCICSKCENTKKIV